MNIFLTSDLHTEMREVTLTAPARTDVVVLAGDIGEGVKGLDWARAAFGLVPVVYVAGNHEYYDGDIQATLVALRRRARKLGIHFLERNSCIIEGVRFLGTTLWTDLGQWHATAVEAALRYSNDYAHIAAQQWWDSQRNRRYAARQMDRLKSCPWSSLPIGRDGRAPFHPIIASLLHRQSVRWLNATLAMDHHGPTVVVSHHLPSYRPFKQMWDEFNADPSTWRARAEQTYVAACYASDLRELFTRYGHRVAAWLHGHLHAAGDFTYRGVRIVSNPRGYPGLVVPGKGDASGFCADKLIRIESNSQVLHRGIGRDDQP